MGYRKSALKPAMQGSMADSLNRTYSLTYMKYSIKAELKRKINIIFMLFTLLLIITIDFKQTLIFFTALYMTG